jgi:hypothetical protein
MNLVASLLSYRDAYAGKYQGVAGQSSLAMMGSEARGRSSASNTLSAA